MAPTDSRTLALRIITRWMETSEFPDRMISGTGPERAFLTELVYGVVRRRRTLHWLANECSERSPVPSTLPALMLGMQQMLFMDRVPDYAAVNDTIEALRQTTRNRGRVAYVNAILRRVGRERHALLQRLSEQPVGIRESHPDLLIDRWSQTYGPEATAALCQWNNSRPGIVLRPRPGPEHLEAYSKRLRQAGIGQSPHPHRPHDFICIDHGTRATALPGFADGDCAIQDPATAEAVDLLNPQPGERLWDACAAPGGKTALIADRMGPQGDLIASDVYDDRIALLEDTLGRLALDTIEVIRADITTPASLPPRITEAPFDGILLDVPCTNSGVLRRRPDARWRFSLERLTRTVALQRQLLDHAAPYLAETGRLVYSTCSLEPEENEQMVSEWVAAHPAFHLADSRTLFPPDSQTDGAYAALLVRR